MKSEFDLIESIKKFNEMYGIEYNAKVKTDLGVERLQNFKHIFFKELDELADIQKETSNLDKNVMILDWLGDLIVYCLSECGRWGALEKIKIFSCIYNQEKEIFSNKTIKTPYSLTGLKTTLFCIWAEIEPSRQSPLLKMQEILYRSLYEISKLVHQNQIIIQDVLEIIMKSNFSKLGGDGKPIIDERGKILKGPNFQPPEPDLEKYLRKNWGI